MAEHKPPILWSPEALDDLDHLWDYYVDAKNGGALNTGRTAAISSASGRRAATARMPDPREPVQNSRSAQTPA